MSNKKKAIAQGEYDMHRYIDLEDAVIDEINAARTEPGYWVRHLEKMQLCFKGDKYTHKKFGSVVYPNGQALVDSAIAYMQVLRPVRPVDRYEYLDRIARDEHGRTKTMENTSSLGAMKGMQMRMSDIQQNIGAYGEMFSFGFPDATEIVKDLILQETMANPMHVNGIFSDQFDRVGIYTAMHARTQLCTMVTFIGDNMQEQPVIRPAPQTVLYESVPVEQNREIVTMNHNPNQILSRYTNVMPTSQVQEYHHDERVIGPNGGRVHHIDRVFDRNGGMTEDRYTTTHTHGQDIGCNICHAPGLSRSQGSYVQDNGSRYGQDIRHSGYAQDRQYDSRYGPTRYY